MTYLERGQPLRDTARFRRRLEVKFTEICNGWQVESQFGKMLATEAGTDVERSSNGENYFPRSAFENGEIRDVLNAITLFFKMLTTKRNVELTMSSAARSGYHFETKDPAVWKPFVDRVIREENMGYRLDDQCGVHIYVDQEFEHSRAATVAVLGHPSLANARSSFEDSFRHLDSTPPDTKAAVRSMFEAAEILAKQIFPETQNLNRRLAESKLKTHIQATHPGDRTEQKVWAGLLDGFGDRIDAMHNYRHGQAADEPVAPSEEPAVFLLSSGCTYVRTLADSYLRAPT
ncbi:MAG: hypothetical protein ABIP61_01850 [Burkholderiaceae bacterium]